ncbi:hypothetical protein F4553_005817 [Allocatelliglobosispora scoriae]|uniref:SH3 domain-containing protein n=1 Tax=Allocatelliglobosispora scoriae TaxID=643052 RepID=A0A841BZR8_9ACTN|nr:hypothetical protein [Allocatelliglobosispora scoriae]MBB5872383.1 hypothetical protein [Allocatelliglobosispora scoriae]
MLTLSVAMGGCADEPAPPAPQPGPTLAATSAPPPADPPSVSVVSDKTTTLDLDGGAHLIIPPGAMKAGAKVSATYHDLPKGSFDGIKPVSPPVELISEPDDAIHGLLTLEFPVPFEDVPAGVDPAVWFGISTYDAKTSTWKPFAANYDAARHMVVALIPHFSWWNPFSWDLGKLWNNVSQKFGEFIDTRSGPAKCSGSAPDWAAKLTGISNEANTPVRACAHSQGDLLVVEMVNNRPYGQVVHLSGEVSWARHDEPSAIDGVLRAAFVDSQVDDGDLYLPPLTHGSIGIKRPASSSTAMSFHAGPSGLTIGTDLVFVVFNAVGVVNALKNLPSFKDCRIPGIKDVLKDLRPGTLRDFAVAVFQCIRDAFTKEVTEGRIAKSKLDLLAAAWGVLSKANVVANAVQLGSDLLWNIVDLLGDWRNNQNSGLGNGFSIAARITGPSPATRWVYRVAGTDGVELTVRSEPRVTGTPLGALQEGAAITIVCQTYGDSVNGSEIWDKLSSGGYVADWYTSTPIAGRFVPGIPRC